MGHSISVSATPSEENLERAIEIRTTVLPQYEVPVTRDSGPESRRPPCLRRMVDEGFLDMHVLAELDAQHSSKLCSHSDGRLRVLDWRPTRSRRHGTCRL